MKIEHPNAKDPTPEELEELEKLKAVIEQAVADGRLTRYEMDRINATIRADGKVTLEELTLVQELVHQKVQAGELSFDWW